MRDHVEPTDPRDAALQALQPCGPPWPQTPRPRAADTDTEAVRATDAVVVVRGRKVIQGSLELVTPELLYSAIK